MADRRTHPLDLVLAPLVQRELDFPACYHANTGGRGRAVVELDSVAQPLERFLGGLTLDLGDVHLLDAVTRVREPVRERAVVRQQQRAGRVRVEPADGDDAAFVANELDDGRPPLPVAGGRDDARRLVEQYVGEPPLGDRRTVELNRVAGRDERVQLARLAVDAHAAGLDQLVRAAPRGDPGAREVGVQAHTAMLRAPVRFLRWSFSASVRATCSSRASASAATTSAGAPP